MQYNDKLPVTIVIATFNSMHVLPKVLMAINSQDYPKDCINVILVDGGSTDSTIEYGKKNGCQVITNPRTEPVYAKYLGYIHTKTKYLIYLDHDEVFDNNQCISDQINCAEETGTKVVLSSGYLNPEGEHPINNYINEFGDPFSYFIYGFSKEPTRFITNLQRRYDINNSSEIWDIVDFGNEKPLPLIELLAIGTLINKEYFDSNFSDFVSIPENLPHLFYVLMTKETEVGVCKHHKLRHYSSESVKGYARKISWRIFNNIYHVNSAGAAGFLVRERLMSNRDRWYSKYKKFLFLPYALLLIPCMIDTLYLAITRKSSIYLIHFPLSIYTSVKILFNHCLKIFGYRPKLKSYDGKKVVEDD